MAQRIITLILLLCSTSAIAGLFDAPGRSNFVPADQAFAFDFQQNQHDLNLTWQIKDGYYLYRKQIKLTSADAAFTDPSLPAGEWHEDEFYGKSEIYRQRLTAAAVNFIGDRLCGGVIVIGDSHGKTIFNQAKGDSFPDALARAGHECDFFHCWIPSVVTQSI